MYKFLLWMLLAGTAFAQTSINGKPNQNLGGVNLTTPAAPLGYTPYCMAFGDSITWGYALVNATLGAYPHWIGQAIGGRCLDEGVPGTVSFQQDATIFANTWPYSTQTFMVYTIGTNNAGVYGADANELAMYMLNLPGQIAWMELSPSRKTSISSGSVTKVGTWNNSIFTTLAPTAPGKQCTGLTCAVTFTGSGSILYLITGAQAGANPAAATLACDGTPTGATLNFTGQSGTNMPFNGTQTTRVSLASGTHSCTVQSTNATGVVDLEWFAFLDGSPIVSDAPWFDFGSVPISLTDTNKPAYRTAQQSVVTALRADGFTHVTYVDNTAAYPNVAQSYADGTLHPSESSQYALAQPYIASFSTLTGVTLPTLQYTGVPATQCSKSASNSLCIGYNAMASLTSGQANTAVGFNVLNALTTGGSNLGIGTSAGQFVTSGTANVLVGTSSGLGVIASNNNIVLGNGSLTHGDGGNNVVVGTGSMIGTGAFHNNLAIGNVALPGATTAQFDSAIGYQALGNITTGSGNTAIGYQAGTQLTSPVLATISNCSFLGFLSTAGADAISECGAIGHSAITSANGAWQIGAGTNATANTMQFQSFNMLDNAGNYNITSLKGPNTVPTGSCPTNGQFVIDQNGAMVICRSGTYVPKQLSGTTAAISGSPLLAGVCATTTATVTGAIPGSPVAVSATDGTLPAALATLSASVTSANTVTVQVCAIAAFTPAPLNYNVIVFGL